MSWEGKSEVQESQNEKFFPGEFFWYMGSNGIANIPGKEVICETKFLNLAR